MRHDISTLEKVYFCIPLVIIVLGLIGNSITLLMLRIDVKLRKITGLVYLSFLIVTDTMSLFVWNLSNFVQNVTETIFNSEIDCNILTFIQFASLQSSGCLLTVFCIDRYITVISTPGSVWTRLPFRTRKSAIIWSTITILFVCSLNSHILFANPGSYAQKIVAYNASNSSFVGTTLIPLTTFVYTDEFYCSPSHSTGIIHKNRITFKVPPPPQIKT